MKIKLAPGITAYKHQLQDIELLWHNPRFANFSEMGAGKTLSAAVVACGLVQDRICDKVLIVCPPILIAHWDRCIHEQLDAKVTTYDYYGYDRVKGLAMLSDVVLTSYQTLVNDLFLKEKRKRSKGQGQARARINPDSLFYRLATSSNLCLLVDEASNLRRVESKRNLAMTFLSRKAKRVYLLTGNPFPNGLQNAYPFLRILSPELYSSDKHFLNEHCIMSKGAFPTVVGYKNLDLLAERVSRVSVRHLKAECLDLPKKTSTVRELEPSEAHLELYNSVLSDEFVELPDGRVLDMTNPFSVITRSRQLASNPGTLGFSIESPKLAQLKDDLEEIGKDHKVAIWVEYVPTARGLKAELEELGWRVAMVADTTRYDTKKELVNFQVGDANAIVINPAAGGAGVDLSMSQYSIFYEYSYNLDHHDQALERSHRPGLKGPLTILYYVTKHTIEESILEALERKKEVSADLLRDPVWLRNFVRYSQTKPKRHAAAGIQI